MATRTRESGASTVFDARSILALLAFLVLTLGVAALGNIFTSSGQEWNDELRKPAFEPPGWVFGAVWTPLYFLIAFAGWRIWENRDRPLGPVALSFWVAQLILNLGWTAVFFGLQEPFWGAVEIVVLQLAILGTIATAWTVSKPAALVLVPYSAWVFFATALNFEIWRLN